MNTKAVYYAISRMLLPTLVVIILASLWTLSPTQTFGFLISQNSWASALRIVLFLAECVWFYYLYTQFDSKEKLNTTLNSENSVEKGVSHNYIESKIYSALGTNKNMYSIEHFKDVNAFVIKY